jgi:UDP-N-acetylglucosamine--dolichyl-phosphate N-acetylglucosaminephosphotransferase
MTFSLILLGAGTSFILTLILLPFTIKLYNQKISLQEDMNKPNKPKVPSLGGLAAYFSFIISLTIIILIKMLTKSNTLNLALLLPGLLSVSIIAFLVFVDDVLIFQLRFAKPFLALFAAIPMMAVVYTSNLIIYIPFLGSINTGLFYPLAIVPIIIIFCSNAINTLADFDGLVPGNGIILTLGMFCVSFFAKSYTGMLIFATLFGALLVLFYYNKYPSKVFCGNVGTLFIGAAIGIGAIIANREQALLIMMIPYIIHFIMQERIIFEKGKKITDRPRERGMPQKNETIKSPYKKSFGLTHFLMLHFKKMTEKRLVYTLMAFELFFVIIAVLNELFKLHYFS